MASSRESNNPRLNRRPPTHILARHLPLRAPTPGHPASLSRRTLQFFAFSIFVAARRFDHLLSSLDPFIWSMNSGSRPVTNFQMIRCAFTGFPSNPPHLYPCPSELAKASLLAFFLFQLLHLCSAVRRDCPSNISGVRSSQYNFPVSGSYRRSLRSSSASGSWRAAIESSFIGFARLGRDRRSNAFPVRIW